jgi:hypothetical protein
MYRQSRLWLDHAEPIVDAMLIIGILLIAAIALAPRYGADSRPDFTELRRRGIY